MGKNARTMLSAAGAGSAKAEPDMNEFRKRNEQILTLAMGGSSPRELAQRFGISVDRIQQILKRFEAERKLMERRTRLREEIRQADDLDKRWPVENLLDALGLVTVTRTSLLRYYERCEQKETSLRDLMDGLKEKQDPMSGFFLTPLLRVRGVGKIGFWSVVNGLTGMDLGPRCNDEWSKRLAEIKRSCGICGATPYWGHNPTDTLIGSATMRAMITQHRQGSPSEGFAI